MVGPPVPGRFQADSWIWWVTSLLATGPHLAGQREVGTGGASPPKRSLRPLSGETIVSPMALSPLSATDSGGIGMGP
ncbi:MAG: hypothetical protein LBJ61_08495 [Deltaproteobacteria bacterium]|nr:hypothetical protein [Deltaproteobacteria bacterium]